MSNAVVPMKVLSLGWGVQSFTLAAMVALGELEPIDAAIHADTTHERSATYAFAAKWKPWLEEHDIACATVFPSSKLQPVDEYGGCMIPAHIEGGGMFDRQCTDAWKRSPMRRWLQDNRKIPRTAIFVDGVAHYVKTRPIEMWLGISIDEVWRMKESRVQYITHRWPLIEKRMTRAACVAWLERHGLEVPSKSACVFCPFQNDREWRQVKDHADDWQQAIAADEMIRRSRPPKDLFAHKTKQPLELVDLSTPEDHGQINMWNEECSGICGV